MILYVTNQFLNKTEIIDMMEWSKIHQFLLVTKIRIGIWHPL